MPKLPPKLNCLSPLGYHSITTPMNSHELLSNSTNIIMNFKHILKISVALILLANITSAFSAGYDGDVGFTDRSGLRWEYPSNKKRVSLEAAKKVCAQAKFDGAGGWRLPEPGEYEQVYKTWYAELDLKLPREKQVAMAARDSFTGFPATFAADGSHRYPLSDTIYPADNSNAHVVCVKKNAGTPKYGAAANSAKAGAASSTPLLTRTTSGGQTAEQIAQQKAIDLKTSKSAAEAKRLRAETKAKDQAAAKARDEKNRLICMAPERRGDCGCMKYFPKDPKQTACSK